MLDFQTLKHDHPELFELVHGTTKLSFSRVAPPETANETSICFLSQASHLPLLKDLKSRLWIVTENLWQKNQLELTTAATPNSVAIATCRNLQISMAVILRYFDRRLELLSFPRGISPQAWIHPSAELGIGVTVGPFSTIGPNVRIGDHSIIGANCTIEGEVQIGQKCFFESHIFVGRQSKIGSECRIKPFASIGSDGFGYAPSPSGILKIPQVGIVVLEDQVDVGSGSCIDRATLTETRIGKCTKIDNLVHVAHNCEIGKYCFLTAGFAIAGSSKIGDYFMTGGCSAVGDHVVIAEKVTLAGASVVTGAIDKPGAYGGNPVQPMQDYLRTRSSLTHIPHLRKQIHRVLKHLGLDE